MNSKIREIALTCFLFGFTILLITFLDGIEKIKQDTTGVQRMDSKVAYGKLKDESEYELTAEQVVSVVKCNKLIERSVSKGETNLTYTLGGDIVEYEDVTDVYRDIDDTKYGMEPESEEDTYDNGEDSYEEEIDNNSIMEQIKNIYGEDAVELEQSIEDDSIVEIEEDEEMRIDRVLQNNIYNKLEDGGLAEGGRYKVSIEGNSVQIK